MLMLVSDSALLFSDLLSTFWLGQIGLRATNLTLLLLFSNIFHELALTLFSYDFFSGFIHYTYCLILCSLQTTPAPPTKKLLLFLFPCLEHTSLILTIFSITSLRSLLKSHFISVNDFS